MKSKQAYLGLIAVMVGAAIILSACGAAAPAEPTTDPNVVFTQVAETVMVSMTQTSEAMPPTATPEPTATIAPTVPVVPTVDVSAQATTQAAAAVPTAALYPTATVQLYGDAAQFNSSKPMDGHVFEQGEEFTFIVCFTNVGDTTWDSTFYLQYTDGNRLWSDASKFYIDDGKTIENGEKWCFYLPSVAPWSPGSYITYWFFKDGDGNKVKNGEVYFAYKVQ